METIILVIAGVVALTVENAEVGLSLDRIR